MQPEAVRKRAYRQRVHTAAGAGQGPGPSSSGPSALNAPAAAVAALCETRPVTASGPESFASVPLVDDSEPMVPPDAEPAPAPASAEDVALVANGVAFYFQLGTQALIAKHPELLTLVPGGAEAAEKYFPAAVLFVRGAAEREAIRMGIRLPYQDLVVVAGALGVATFGLFGPAPKNGNGRPHVVPGAPQSAKDANSPSSAPASSSPEPVSTDAGDDEELVLD